MSVISRVRAFKGEQFVFKHTSDSLKCEMTFGAYVPDHEPEEQLTTLVYLSGLTCTHANFMEKSGMQRYASEYRMVVIHPDTSPRGDDIPDDTGSWDFGKGAGFYVDALVEPWSTNYNMYSYVTKDLLDTCSKLLPMNRNKLGIFGHSMGGHGALVIGLRNPTIFRSISAFAPISNPTSCPWGQKAFSGYLGSNAEEWQKYDASEVLKNYKGEQRDILVHQGTSDNFLDQLKPQTLQSNEHAKVQLELADGYDHSYYFIQTFIKNHFDHHHKNLA
ncbi:unnamed protein product [Auanema sp. JU1783]|nr:unnamed protein product [Auanema sp. JU1783]